ncbi:FG-GAP repeat domain-containing protein [Nannocystis pusilla]|uniref:FG-GAP-like repeat-containing protein n=1 Tax=Nannocystis pusilla TaxID=889268 RepID=A0ABS7TUN1_9BACT|nr:VCBS repeat-containing protein [Nannocystis pusilla]MBZ5711968.1 FG-GAP-like repeat-containing protein [Nannocystis pusilla]
MPLVINLTDDNQDGAIDLCDIPDVVVVAGPNLNNDTSPSRLYVLDGATGAVHFFAAEPVQFGGTPAAGDIDGDGIAEIVAIEPGGSGRLIAFEHDGSLKWKSNTTWPGSQSSAVALADVDQDGDVEIIAGAKLYDHNGIELWTRGNDAIYGASMAADLDGQPGLEVLVNGAAFHADGSTWYDTNNFGWAFPQVANLDGDPQPEVLISRDNSIELRQHDGTLVWQFTPNNQGDLSRPINIHDLDGDGEPEFGVSGPGRRHRVRLHRRRQGPGDLRRRAHGVGVRRSGLAADADAAPVGHDHRIPGGRRYRQRRLVGDPGGLQHRAQRRGAPVHRPGGARRPGPVGPGPPDLESAHLSCDQRARGRDDPAIRGPALGEAQHVPHAGADLGRRRGVHPAAVSRQNRARTRESGQAGGRATPACLSPSLILPGA